MLAGPPTAPDAEKARHGGANLSPQETSRRAQAKALREIVAGGPDQQRSHVPSMRLDCGRKIAAAVDHAELPGVEAKSRLIGRAKAFAN